MKYKTIILELLEQNPDLYRRLKRNRQVRQTMDRLAVDLQRRHLELRSYLQQSQPGAGSSELSSQAMEMAIAELREQLVPLSDSEDEGTQIPQHIAERLHPDSQIA
jgi:hypothetical protein